MFTSSSWLHTRLHDEVLYRETDVTVDHEDTSQQMGNTVDSLELTLHSDAEGDETVEYNSDYVQDQDAAPLLPIADPD